ncbi:hypothetical protein [Parendozoicomonas sp. Alg238-R29]|uniref:hypothetical protein n=1 Tax=Parendozoicomonas sp. Alg238-R29 TaxID=2993446 RepID=UPI00248E8546|nr:hypothetical protein [Parendozoicomonas sp. Alg238-R29]
MNDLTRWDHQELHSHVDIDVDTVTLALCQHAGGNSEPKVSVGGRVETGQIIAEMPEGKLGSTIHSSINGTVTVVDSDSIIISRKAA